MRRALALTVALSVLAASITGCSAPGNQWHEKATAYAATLSVDDPGKVAEYIEATCSDPDLSGPDIAARVGSSWDELTGTGLSGLRDAVQAVCPEQFLS